MKKKASDNFLKYMYDIICILCYSFTIFYQSFRAKFDADRCLHQSFLVLFLYFSDKKENFGINDAVAEQNVTTLQKVSSNIVIVVMKHFQNALSGSAMLHNLD